MSFSSKTAISIGAPFHRQGRMGGVHDSRIANAVRSSAGGGPPYHIVRAADSTSLYSLVNKLCVNRLSGRSTNVSLLSSWIKRDSWYLF